MNSVCGKKPFRSEVDAVAHQREFGEVGKPFYTYYCFPCDGFHISTTPVYKYELEMIGQKIRDHNNIRPDEDVRFIRRLSTTTTIWQVVVGLSTYLVSYKRGKVTHMDSKIWY